MILRRFTKHVTDQNWFAVGLDVVVVILGVYLGIILGTVQQKNQTLDAVQEGLQSLKNELDTDVVRLDEIIAFQKMRVSVMRDTIAHLNNAEINEEKIDKNLEIIFGENDTYFPSVSAYLAMQSNGFLVVIPDDRLRQDITRLYEELYKRLSHNGNAYDQMVYLVAPTEVFPHWDRAGDKLQHLDPDSITIVTNWMHLLRETGETYHIYLETIVRPEIVKISGAI